ncbi:MAG: VWA domain-containing protein, partial [Pseudomonadota bacterium]
MSDPAQIEVKDDGRLVANVVHFTQALRKAGVSVGTGQVQTAIKAIGSVGFSNRLDFYYLLRATLIRRAHDLDVFHQVFSMFWRDPEFLQSLMHNLSPQLEGTDAPPKAEAARRRAEDALGDREEKPVEKPKSEVV